MESDGSLTASQAQNSFARNYNDGVGQGSAADALTIFGDTENAAATAEFRIAAIAPRATAAPMSSELKPKPSAKPSVIGRVDIR